MKNLAGVDEVGRGSLIGPVYAAAVVFKERINKKIIKDSKKLSKKLHPDKGGNEDDFMSISEMYNEENILGMYIKAEELGIELEDINLANIENTFDGSCIVLEEKTNLKKKTLAWLWATCPPEGKENMKKMFIEKYKLEYRK